MLVYIIAAVIVRYFSVAAGYPWVTTLPGLPDHDPWDRHRSYPPCTWIGRVLDCQNAYWTKKLTSLPKIPFNAQEVILLNNIFPVIKSTDFKHLEVLKSLSLGNCQIRHIESQAFKDLRQIEKIDLGSNKLRSLPRMLFYWNTNLKALDLSDNTGILDNIESVAAICIPSLEELSLIGIVNGTMKMDSFITADMAKRLRRLKYVYLTGNNLTRIPKWLSHIKSLRVILLNRNSIESLRTNWSFTDLPDLRLALQKNKFKKLSKADFVAFEKVKKLFLEFEVSDSGNTINTIDNDTFPNSLVGLSLGGLGTRSVIARGNSLINNVSEALTNTKLQYLFLEDCGLKTVYREQKGYHLSEFFRFIKSSSLSLQKLYLRKNFISQLEPKVFKEFSNLLTLDISSCHISRVARDSFQGLNRLKTLLISENPILTFVIPDILTYCKSLTEFDSFNMYAAREPIRTTVGNNSNIEVLNLAGIPLDAIEVANMPALRSLKIQMEYPYFNIANLLLNGLPSLVELGLPRSNVRFTRTFEYEQRGIDAFENVPHLQKLDLGENSLGHSDPKDMEVLFLHLRYLRELDLRNNYISVLFPNIFESLKKLNFLNLAKNNIGTLTNGLFRNLKKLKKLDLSQNNLVTLSAEDFIGPLTTLQSLEISHNKFSCDCSIRWLKSFLNKKKFQSLYNKEEECASPEEYKGTLLVNYEPAWVDCDNNKVHLSLIVVGPICVMIGIAAAIVHFRWDIKFSIAQRKARRRQQINDDALEYEGEDIPLRQRERYDAFVSYAYEDLAWIKNYLIPNLEEEDDIRFKLYIHDRDSLPGTFIVDNIQENMDRSRKAIFLISEKFLDSDWNSFELNMSQVKLFEDRKDMIILIFLEKLPGNRIPRTLRTLMRHVPFLQWPRKERKRRIFWKKIKLLLMVQNEDAPLLLNAR